MSALFDHAVDLDPMALQQLLTVLQSLDRERATHLRELLDADAGSDSHLPEPAEADWRQVTAAAAAAAPVGDFRLLRPLGHGGMGEVWLGERQVGGARQQAAIKLLRYTLQPAMRRRFMEEQRILASLRHPGVARLIDAGTLAEGIPWIAMEYVDGVAITEFCRRQQLNVEARLRLFLGVLDAVGHAHQNLVIHRDIKPGNVFVDSSGEPRLLDFGIAKVLEASAAATATADRFFSLASAAPEHFSGEPCNVATDVYQLGLLLYELLCGKPAQDFDGMHPAEVQARVRERSPPAPSSRADDATAPQFGLASAAQLSRRLRGDLDRIVLHALRKQQPERYRSTLEFALDIEAYLEGRPVRAVGQGRLYRARKFIGRHALALSATGVALLLILSLMTLLLVRDAELARTHTVVVQEREKAERVNRFLLDLFRASDPTAPSGLDLRTIVRQAWERQLERRDFSDTVVSLALIEAALGLGEREAASEMIEAMRGDPGLEADERRELLLLSARLATIEGGDVRLRGVIDELALSMNGASESQRVRYTGYVAQLLLPEDPAHVVELTNVTPVPLAWVRLRSRALTALDRHGEAEALLREAGQRQDISPFEKLGLLQALTHTYLTSARPDSAAEVASEAYALARRTLGERNLRVLPYANSYAIALAGSGALADAVEILDELLSLEGISESVRGRMLVNRLITGSQLPPPHAPTVALSQQVLGDAESAPMVRLQAALALVRQQAGSPEQETAALLLLSELAAFATPDNVASRLGELWLRSLQAKPGDQHALAEALRTLGVEDPSLQRWLDRAERLREEADG
ncbi:MAG: serine/threonine protein kinase [Aquimonas sp.]|nr:serine/threonine protein kinase [Aquimonas sp.]